MSHEYICLFFGRDGNRHIYYIFIYLYMVVLHLHCFSINIHHFQIDHLVDLDTWEISWLLC